MLFEARRAAILRSSYPVRCVADQPRSVA